MKKLFTHFLFLTVAAIFLFGCTNSPKNHHEIDSYDDRIHYQTYATSPSAVVFVQAYNKKTKKWVVIESFWGPKEPTLEAGQLGNNSPALYEINEHFYLSGTCFWRKDCTEPEYGKRYTAKIKSFIYIDNQPFDIVTLDEDSMSCAYDRMDDGEDYAMAVWHCRSKDYPVINIHTKKD